MMGDGAAAARPNRQPRTQSARRGPASAPRAARASVIALPGPARRPGVAGSVRVAASPPGWRLLRRAACRSEGPLDSVASALPGSAAHGPAPAPLPAPPPPVLAGAGSPFVCLKPQMRSLQPPPEEVWMQRKQGRAAARCGRLGWEGAGSARREGGRTQARPSPPHSPTRPPPLFSSLFLSPPLSSLPPPRRQLLQASACTIGARPLYLHPPVRAQSLRTPYGKHLGRPLQTPDVLRLESHGSCRGAWGTGLPALSGRKGQRWGGRVGSRWSAARRSGPRQRF